MQAKTKPGLVLALVACLLTVGVIGLGAFTRLVDAGLGCPDWPTCYGHALWPDSAEEIAAANAKPEFADTPVETDKTWPEQVHRIFASTLGLFGLGLFAIGFRNRGSHPGGLITTMLLVLLAGTVARVVVGDVLDPYLWILVAMYMTLLFTQWRRYGSGTYPFKLTALIAGFLILQGLFGMWTVTLNLWPQVVTAHLLGGFTAFSLIWLLVLRLRNRRWSVSAETINSVKPWAMAGLAVVVLQVALGGWTTSNYAAVACPDLPTCQGQWLPPMNFAEGFNITQHIGPNYLGGAMDNDARVAIHFSHRVGAILTLVVVGLLSLRLMRSGYAKAATLGCISAGLLGLQLALGLSNILFKFPVAVAVAHNLGGVFLLLCMVTVVYYVSTADQE